MKTLLKSSLGHLRIIAFLEGLSFLLLLFIAMPLKYIWHQPEMVRIVGMSHGILFVLYLLYVLKVRDDLQWSIKTTLIAMVASVVPFGTFYADTKLFRVN